MGSDFPPSAARTAFWGADPAHALTCLVLKKKRNKPHISKLDDAHKVSQDINCDGNLGVQEHGLKWSCGDEKRSWVTLLMWLVPGQGMGRKRESSSGYPWLRDGQSHHCPGLSRAE